MSSIKKIKKQREKKRWFVFVVCLLFGHPQLPFAKPFKQSSSLSLQRTAACLQKSNARLPHGSHHDWDPCIRKKNSFLQIPLDSMKTLYLTPNSVRSHGHSFALVPQKLKSTKPYVLLYLHGLNHQIVNEKPLPISRLEYDKIPEQIQKSGHSHDVMGLFPLADPTILFPPESPNYYFPISTYLSESLSRLPGKFSPDKLPLIVVAHSSGGSVLQGILSSTSLPNLRAVVFLDGINREAEVPWAKSYLKSKIQKQIAWLKEHPLAKERTTYLQSLPRFFFYHTFQYQSYPKAHQQLGLFLQQLWKEQAQKLPPREQVFLQKLQKHYRIISLNKKITHSNIMRSGVIKRVLQTIPKESS